MAAPCIFCKIIKGAESHSRQTKSLAELWKGEIPCMKIFESEKTLAFLDIGPVSRGHSVNHKLQPFLYSESWRANTLL